MTGAEKRMFSESLRDRTANHALLFDAINKLATRSPDYNENKIVASLKKYPALIRQLPKHKNYLYRQLINVLLHREEQKTEDKLLYILDEVSVLNRKQLYKTAGKKLAKGLALAEKYEHYEIALLFIKELKSYYQRIAHQDILQEQIKLTNKQSAIMREISHLGRLGVLGIELFKYFSMAIKSDQEKAVISILDETHKIHLKSESKLGTFRAYTIFIMANRILNKLEESYKYSHELLQHMKDTHWYWMRPPEVETYIKTVFNHTVTCAELGLFAEHKENLHTLEEFQKEFPDYSNLNEFIAMAGCHYCMNTGSFEEVLQRAERYMQWYQQIHSKNQLIWCSIATYYSYGLLALKRFTEANRFIHSRLLGKGNEWLPESFKAQVLLISCLIYHEQGKIDLSQRTFKQLEPLLTQQATEQNKLNNIIPGFRDLFSNDPSRKQYGRVLHEYEALNIKETTLNENLDIKHWLKHRYTGELLSKIVREANSE